MDAESLVAGLLHDTVEDTQAVSFEEIEVRPLCALFRLPAAGLCALGAAAPVMWPEPPERSCPASGVVWSCGAPHRGGRDKVQQGCVHKRRHVPRGGCRAGPAAALPGHDGGGASLQALLST